MAFVGRCLIVSVMFFIGACAPKKSSSPAPENKIDQLSPSYEEPATSTLSALTNQNNQKLKDEYQAPPSKIINNDKVEIIIGEAKINNAKVTYNSNDRKLLVIGDAEIYNDGGEKVAAKSFLLSGENKRNDMIFRMDDELQNQNKELIVKAQSICISHDEGSNDCNHVIIDIFISYNKKIYSEQIEVNRNKPKAIDPAPPQHDVPPAPRSPNPPQTQPTPPPTQDENEDQSANQQSESHDDSIEGRYQGTTETADLDALFNPKSEDEPVPTDKDKTDKKDTQLNPDVVRTKNGDIRQVNQSIGFVDNGKLRNATSILTRQQSLQSINKAFFEIVAPDRKRYFGTHEMAEMLTRMGEMLNQKFSKRLYISNISGAQGGPLSPHASHQSGLDADIAYPNDLEKIKFPLVVKMSSSEFYPKNYSAEKTYELFKFLFSQKDIQIDRIFVDQKIKNDLCRVANEKNELVGDKKALVEEIFTSLQHVRGHGDHFHVRLKCSKLDPACRGRIYKKQNGCTLIAKKN